MPQPELRPQRIRQKRIPDPSVRHHPLVHARHNHQSRIIPWQLQPTLKLQGIPRTLRLMRLFRQTLKQQVQCFA